MSFPPPKAVKQCAPQCETCTHSIVEPQPGEDNLLCREPRVLEAFERERVAAGLARGVVCGAQFHQDYRR